MARCMLAYSSVNCEAYFGRQEFFILIHYAHRLQPLMAEKLYYAGETEYIYRSDKKLPLKGLEYDDDVQYPFWDIGSLCEVASFIKYDLIPALSQESNNNIIGVLGGYDKLKTEIDIGGDYKERFGIIHSEENIFNDIEFYVCIALELKEIIEDAIAYNTPYKIRYNGNC